MTSVPDMSTAVHGDQRWVRVSAPGTSANLGSGFDAVGVAVDLRDQVAARLLPGRSDVIVEVTGEGAQSVPRDESHLVIRVLRDAMVELGAPAEVLSMGLHLRAHNLIPHGRGLGSSASAIVAGLALAHGLARPGVALDREWLVDRSSALEGHPDNATAAVLGGGILAFSPADGGHTIVEELEVHPSLSFVAFVPDFEVATSGARQVLPDDVPRLDAVQQAIRSAFLPRALTLHPENLLLATQDFLHQQYRAGLMAPSAALLTALRAAAVPATISGAGPTVLAVGTPEQLAGVASDSVQAVLAQGGFAQWPLPLGSGVRFEGEELD